MQKFRPLSQFENNFQSKKLKEISSGSQISKKTSKIEYFLTQFCRRPRQMHRKPLLLSTAAWYNMQPLAVYQIL